MTIYIFANFQAAETKGEKNGAARQHCHVYIHGNGTFLNTTFYHAMPFSTCILSVLQNRISKDPTNATNRAKREENCTNGQNFVTIFVLNLNSKFRHLNPPPPLHPTHPPQYFQGWNVQGDTHTYATGSSYTVSLYDKSECTKVSA